jgi:3-dehydroquinate synthase
MTRRVAVGLGARAYAVDIGRGLIAEAGMRLAPVLPRRRTAIVTDDVVAALHAPALKESLDAAGIAVSTLVLPNGEGTKSWAGLSDLTDRMLALNLDRGDVIIALGGGVIGDIAGFAAAIYKRGIDFIQVPTTLLAQVDSSVGGKTAIDTPRGKNLIGAFHQPRAVLADLRALDTLPERERRCGYAEVIKYGLLGDRAFFDWLEVNGARVVDGDDEALLHAVARSVEMKAEIVAEDEKEASRRALLNLGHTFGHALEAETGFGEALKHGEAVAIGMAMAFRFSAALGLCSSQDAVRAQRAIAAVGLPTAAVGLPGWPFATDRLTKHMAQDKKAEGGRLTFILARAIGEAFVAKDMDVEPLQAFLKTEGARG